MKTRLILTSVMLLVLLAFSSTSIAGVGVNIGVSLPPLVISAPPVVAVIPETYVYFCPDIAMDIFFYDGYWYRLYDGNWYSGVDYNGPWVYLAVTSVPAVFFQLPPNYRAIGYQRIPYAELHRNWSAWQRDRYWEHHAWGRNDLGRERQMGVAPRYEQHPAPAPGQTGRTLPTNRGGQNGASMHREMGVTPGYNQHTAPAPGHTGAVQQHSVQQHQGGQRGGSTHREMGVAPRFEQSHAPASGQAGHTGPVNKTPAPRAPSHGNEHGNEHGR